MTHELANGMDESNMIGAERRSNSLCPDDIGAGPYVSIRPELQDLGNHFGAPFVQSIEKLYRLHEPPPDITFVYVIGRPQGPIKVGISKRPEKRAKSISTGCPYPIEVLHTKEVRNRSQAVAIEREFHRVYADHRLNGEWFNLDARIAIYYLCFGEDARG